MAQSVVVLGAGMAGLFTALALAPSGGAITLIDRDPPPPDGDAETAFETWRRRGVGHLRQSHGFLARLRSLIQSEHPALLEALRAAGARELTFADGLPGPLRARYKARPEDEAMAVIVSRRTTFELVIRRYVEQAANVTIRSGVFARGLIGERDPSGDLTVRGLLLEDGGEALGDIVIDAGGRASPMADWLARAGAIVPEEVQDCQILYYTRFYRLLPGQAEPPRGEAGATGDLGYLKFGVFPADNGTFSITLAVPEVEETLRASVVRPEIFAALCASLPGVAPWTDPARAAAVSRVHGMGKLASHWREMAPLGRPVALNLFSVGDSLARSNPLFGRGCSFAAVEAHLLRDVLAQTDDSRERARRYSAGVRGALRPYYLEMLEQDRTAARRALNGLDPDRKPSPRGRAMRGFLEDGVAIALRRDPDLLRAAMRAFHMLAPPRTWLTRPAVLAKILMVWMRGRRANAAFYPARPGPERREMFEVLGLPPRADLDRIRAGV